MVVLAALINVSRLLKRDLKKFKVVVAGAGAAGTATARILLASGVKDLVVCDSSGIVYAGRKLNMNVSKRQLAKATNPRGLKGRLATALRGADVFIGVSTPNIVTPEAIRTMANDPIVFALANPDPEIAPEKALPLARVMATGRSDYPNQINNMLGFSGIFRGLLDVRARGVNEEVKIAAAKAIAGAVESGALHEDYILPSIFDRKVVHAVAAAVAKAAMQSGLAGKEQIKPYSAPCVMQDTTI